MKLAEKYVDFNTLVVLCEIKSDNDLLESYLDKFYDSVIILITNFLTIKTLVNIVFKL